MIEGTPIGRLLSPAGFGLVLLCLLLPFLTVSCTTADGRAQATLTGLDLVVGSGPTYGGDDIGAAEQDTLDRLFSGRYDTEPLMLLAAAVLLVGMAAALIRNRRTRDLTAIWLAAAAAALLVAGLERTVLRLGQLAGGGTLGSPVVGVTQTRYGFWLALGLLGALAVGHVLAMRYDARQGARLGSQGGPSPDNSG